MKINTRSLVGTRNWLVQVDYKLKGVFDSEKEAKAFIKKNKLMDAKISRTDIVGIKKI